MNGLALALVTNFVVTPAPTRTTDVQEATPALQVRTLAQSDPMSPPAVAPTPPLAEAPTAVAPAPPPRDPAPSGRGLSLWGVLPYSYGGFGFGFGARFALPLPIPSLLPKDSRIRDNWSLEFGADYVRFSLGYFSSDYSVNWLLPVAGVRWNVWLTDKFAVYPKAEAGYEIAWVSGFPSGSSAPTYGGFFISGAAGLLYQVAGSLTLRAEAGSFGFKGGIGLAF
jgi:hypothetical protein